MYPSLSSILIVGFMLAVSICPENANGLKCYKCNPCDKKSPGILKECNSRFYKNLPDKGKLACSYEHRVGGAIRKKCTFLRDDPDAGNVANDEISCSQSPMDLNRLDCFCFTDACNMEWPHKDRPGRQGEETDPAEAEGGGGSKFQRGSSVLNIVMIGLLTWTVVLASSWN